VNKTPPHVKKFLQTYLDFINLFFSTKRTFALLTIKKQAGALAHLCGQTELSAVSRRQ
jgi:hypothetical protein